MENQISDRRASISPGVLNGNYRRVPPLLIFLSLVCMSAQASQLTVSLEKPPGSVHPMRSNTLEAVLIGNQVFEPLVSIGPSGEIQPLLVESWHYEAARHLFQFNLRDNIRFSNGSPVTSRHVVDTFKRIIAENRVQNFSRIRGAAAFAQKRTREVSGLKIQDSRRFSIELDVAYPRFLADLADPYASIFLDDGASPLPRGTGPYMFAEASDSGHRVVISRSPQGQALLAGFDSIVFTADRQEPAELYFGEPARPSDARLRKLEYFDTEVVFLSLNAANPELSDIRTRAYLGSVLTTQLIDDSLGPIAYRLGGYIPLGTAGYSPEVTFRAAAAPVRKPKSVSVFNYMPRLTPLAERYCSALKADGVPCRLTVASVDDMYKAKADGSLQVAFIRQKSTTYSVEYLLSCFTSSSACNTFTTKTANPAISKEMDGLFDQMLTIPADDKKALLNLYRKMDAAVAGHALAKAIRYGVNKAVWHDAKVSVPPLDTLGPFSMNLANVKLEK